jgi:hypothetical protein
MEDVNANRPDSQRSARGKAASPRGPVVVSAHGDDRSDRAQRDEHVGIADVARVDDQVARAKRL